MDQSPATIALQPMQWGSLPFMGDADVAPLSGDDAACFRDLRDVLRKHGALARFGVFLIHKHFEIGDDEDLVEHTDPDTRRLVIQPRKKAEIDPDSTITTNWIFKDTEEIAAGYCTCARGPEGHYGYHRKA